jgi:periplasmic divalent cation tolerance protein
MGGLFKNTHVLYHELQDELRQMHPYENPEIIAMPIVGGNKTHLDWIRSETIRPS